MNKANDPQKFLSNFGGLFILQVSAINGLVSPKIKGFHGQKQSF